MPSAARLAAQGLAYAVFAAALAYLSAAPAYRHMDPGLALIKLSLIHPGQRKEACPELTPEEMARLPPNMRRPVGCPRARHAVWVELIADGETIYQGERAPGGLWSDGPSHFYVRLPIAPGRHRLEARLRDGGRTEGFDHAGVAEVELAAGQNFVVDFRAESGGFSFGPAR
jgi:hypothetical protein